MIGITSFGTYIPWYRIDRKLIFEQLGWFNAATVPHAKGEKAVANYDEDTLSLAHAAADACLRRIDAPPPEGVYLASLSLPYIQRQNANIVADALGLGPGGRRTDFTGSLKAGTTALLAALDAVAAGSVNPALVCAADCRLAKPGSVQEHQFGDGASALLVGQDNVVAEFKAGHSIAHDFVDYRQINGERFLHAWEERWIREAGLGRIIPEAVEGLLAETGLGIGDFAKIIIPCPTASWLKNLARKLGAEASQIPDTLQGSVGDTGTALPLMMLAAALEDAAPGDNLLMIGFGSGADALWFQVTDAIVEVRRRGQRLADQLSRRRQMTPYGKYLVFRELIPVDAGIRGEIVQSTAMTVLWQQGKTVSALEGVRCRRCGTPQYPRHKVCVNPDCEAIDDMEPYGFAHRMGRVVSFTGDNLVFSWDPPSIYGLIDFEGGGRILLDFTDCTLEDVSVGMPVRMGFRRKYADRERGYFGYYWKAVPA